MAHTKFPSGTSTNKAGLVFAHDGATSFWAVVLDRNTGLLSIHQVTSGSWSGALASSSVTINDNTSYEIRVSRKQTWLQANVVGQVSLITYTASGDIGTGQSGAFADATGIDIDDAKFYDSTRKEPLTPRISGATDASISSGTLLVQDLVRGEHWSPGMIRANLRGGSGVARAAAVSQLPAVLL